MKALRWIILLVVLALVGYTVLQLYQRNSSRRPSEIATPVATAILNQAAH